MKIAAGTPATIPGVSGDLVIEWARQADLGPFSSLCFVDRVVYPNFEVMTTLGATAAVTKRIRLMPTVLIGPIRSPGLLAKQAATVDALSNGRLTLGMGVGIRSDDYTASDMAYGDRGKRFDRQLETMTRVWRGEAFSQDVRPIGPSPVQAGGPELLIGAFAPAALARIGRWAHGYIGAGPAEGMAPAYKVVQDGWSSAGRSGRPRFVAVGYFALGPDTAERGAVNVRHYYATMGDYAEHALCSLCTTPEEIRAYVRACEEAGADEVGFMPTIPEMHQLSCLADVVG
jgi:alkanesulfonate monooxygenase SsuD/methylene tetrahydromethanopterin reductase-like flavin-dependent oxidoreductase (luciferase family)